MYLRNMVKAEPCCWKWYAWPHLISPITAGFNIKNRHLKIMESFLQSPEIHRESLKIPQLKGGPFIDLPDEYVKHVENLLAETKQYGAHLIALSNDVQQLIAQLEKNCLGDTLEPYYQSLPDGLKGLVELVYDASHRVSARFIEPLIYKKYYVPGSQELVLSIKTELDRQFALSTPCVEKPDQIRLNMPFSDERLDLLFQARYRSSSVDELSGILELLPAQQKRFTDFFSSQRSISHQQLKPLEDRQIMITYYGHACVLIRTNELSILTDPVISYGDTGSQCNFNDLPPQIDYVLLTHNHQDHVLFETLLQLRHKINCIVVPNNNTGVFYDPAMKLILSNIGFKNIIELKEFESLKLTNNICVTGLPFLGEHADLDIRSKIAYHVTAFGKSFLFAADSNNLDPVLYDYIYQEVGKVDILFIGMECFGAPLSWLYGPILSSHLPRSHDNNRRLSGSNFDRAWDMVKKLRAGQVCVYAMGQEPWLNYIMTTDDSEQSLPIRESNKLIEICKEHGIEAERLYFNKEISL